MIGDVDGRALRMKKRPIRKDRTASRQPHQDRPHRLAKEIAHLDALDARRKYQEREHDGDTRKENDYRKAQDKAHPGLDCTQGL